MTVVSAVAVVVTVGPASDWRAEMDAVFTSLPATVGRTTISADHVAAGGMSSSLHVTV